MVHSQQKEYLDFSIRQMSGDPFRLFAGGMIYWIPGLETSAADSFAFQYRHRLNRALRKDDCAWFDAHFRYADAQIVSLFGQRRTPYLICALIASPEYWDEGYSFLQAELTQCRNDHVAFACAAFLRKLSEVYDAILDGRPIKHEYAHFQTILFDASDALSVVPLPFGAKGINGLPANRISINLGTLTVAKSELQLSFPETGITIEMPALCRALYVLLLRHPEGIKRTEFWRFQSELTALYKQSSAETDIHKLEDTIARLVLAHNPQSRDNLKHRILYCNRRLKQAITDPQLCKPYLLTTYANKHLTIPIAKKSELICFQN